MNEKLQKVDENLMKYVNNMMSCVIKFEQNTILTILVPTKLLSLKRFLKKTNSIIYICICICINDFKRDDDDGWINYILSFDTYNSVKI